MSAAAVSRSHYKHLARLRDLAVLGRILDFLDEYGIMSVFFGAKKMRGLSGGMISRMFGGGGPWNNHCTLFDWLEDLAQRGLIENHDREGYRLTPAGRQYLKDLRAKSDPALLLSA